MLQNLWIQSSFHYEQHNDFHFPSFFLPLSNIIQWLRCFQAESILTNFLTLLLMTFLLSSKVRLRKHTQPTPTRPKTIRVAFEEHSTYTEKKEASNSFNQIVKVSFTTIFTPLLVEINYFPNSFPKFISPSNASSFGKYSSLYIH